LVGCSEGGKALQNGNFKTKLNPLSTGCIRSQSN